MGTIEMALFGLLLQITIAYKNQSYTSLSVPISGRDGSYYLYLPDNTTFANPPLVIDFHGLDDSCTYWGGSCGDEYPDCNWLKEVDARGFYYVRACSQHKSWNAGTCCPPSGGRGYNKPDDLDFGRDVIRDVISKYPNIDRERIFSVGFSNGAMMSEVLACNGTESMFRGVCSIEGVVEIRPGNAEGLDACDTQYNDKTRAVSVLKIHALYDEAVPINGDPILGFPSSYDDFDRWASRNNCTGSAVTTVDLPKYTGLKYEMCDDGSSVELVKKDEAGHKWTINDEWDSTNYCLDFLLGLK